MNDFGIILLEKTGVYWEQQTAGVACHHEVFEGVFIPLEQPFRVIETITNGIKGWEKEDLLDSLTNANYNYSCKKIKKTWKYIDEFLQYNYGMKYKIAEPPKDMPHPEEGYKYITITKIGDNWNGNLDSLWDLSGLIGKTVVLIYPNCD